MHKFVIHVFIRWLLIPSIKVSQFIIIVPSSSYKFKIPATQMNGPRSSVDYFEHEAKMSKFQ